MSRDYHPRVKRGASPQKRDELESYKSRERDLMCGRKLGGGASDKILYHTFNNGLCFRHSSQVISGYRQVRMGQSSDPPPHSAAICRQMQPRSHHQSFLCRRARQNRGILYILIIYNILYIT